MDDDGWNSTHCTRPKCRQALDPGAGLQFLDAKGLQQRYCWRHWQDYCVELEKKEALEKQKALGKREESQVQVQP